jgi:ParB-like chromosome segregation protein Spo0J
MNINKIKISEVKSNPNNPRIIKDDKFKKLVQSIKDFPEMLNIRPIVVNQDMIILGGNMRYKACKEAGLKEIPIIKTDLTEAQQREFLIKDNTSGGEWDWEVLANEWDNEQLESWGLDLPKFEQDYEEIIPSGYEENQRWFLNIEFELESNCQEWYDKLINEGLICKIVQ